MLRTVTFYLSFLFLVSFLYHLSYWSQFDIDIFQYLQIQDFIKGVAYPLRFASFFAFFFALLVALTSRSVLNTQTRSQPELDLLRQLEEVSQLRQADFTNAEEWAAQISVTKPELAKIITNKLDLLQDKRRRLIRNAGFFFYIGVPVACIIVYFIPHPVFAVTTAFSLTTAILFALQTRVGKFTNIFSIPLEHSQWIYVVDEMAMTLLFFLPINAILMGFIEGKQLTKKETYKYSTATDIGITPKVPADSSLIYLGKASSTHFFVSHDLERRYIVPATESRTLVFSVYSKAGW